MLLRVARTLPASRAVASAARRGLASAAEGAAAKPALIETELSDGVMTITFSNEKKLNAWTMVRALLASSPRAHDAPVDVDRVRGVCAFPTATPVKALQDAR